ncbi:MAG: glutamine--fructose-6-phosphate transaminase (isomerizing) [Candidatus Paceibacterota bacterium]
MCGIVAYVGKRQAFPMLLSGLIRVEYRGYDSFGFYVPQGDSGFLFKKVGKISAYQEELSKMEVKGTCGLAHTRWATTGDVTEINAHPHHDCHKDFFLVHNGIIENYKELKDELLKEGHKFYGETDTEVIAHLIEKNFKGDLSEAVKETLKVLRGTYGLAVVSKKDPDKLVVARISSPLLVGIMPDGYIAASDPLAVISYTDKVIYLDDYEMMTLTPNGIISQKEKVEHKLDINVEKISKGGFDHFMLKEIHEEPQAVENVMRGRVLEKEGTFKFGGLELIEEKLRAVKRLKLLACGTSHYASILGKYFLEDYAGLLAEAELASEFRYRPGIVSPDLGAIFISQSGETADTLGALHELKKKGILTLGLTNVVGSSQAREADAGIYFHAGPEVAVASTKAFVGQVTALAMLTTFLARQRKMDFVQGKEIVEAMQRIPSQIQEILEQKEKIKELAGKYCQYKNFFFLGRKYSFPVALEGALKLKEISYIHAEGVAGGEIKHGPLSLIDPDFISVAICPQDSVYDKMLVNIEEIKTRKGKVLAIATSGDNRIKASADNVFYVPKTLELLNPILSIVPLHLFAYYMAVRLNREVDKPRNLAKSVTVE